MGHGVLWYSMGERNGSAVGAHMAAVRRQGGRGGGQSAGGVCGGVTHWLWQAPTPASCAFMDEML